MAEKLLNKQSRAWAEIDLDSIIHNYKTIDGKICCVVKADAYGHGASFLAELFQELGASYLAVSNIEEAIQLRNANITIPILILGYTPVNCVNEIYYYDLEQTIYNSEYAFLLNKSAEQEKIKIKVHLKIDTGMGRIGFQFHNGVNELNLALRACNYSNLLPVGVFTHFAISDEGVNEFTNEQFSYFMKACEFFKKNGIIFKVKHCSNSAAIINYPSFKMDMVRAGLSLYGINPTNNNSVKLTPALSLWSVVSNVKTIHKGDTISYGRTFVAKKDMTVATIPIGYADGFLRSNQGNRVFINGNYCKIIGRICMDQTMVECDNAKIGDLVEIYGNHISIAEVAKFNHTIPYEILCSIAERVPRVYKKNGVIVKIVDKLL